MKIETLTAEQETLMDVVVKEYENYVLTGDDSYDEAVIREGIDFIYGLAKLKSPEIIICPSPMDMVIQAKIDKGQAFDNIGCGYDSGWTAFYDYMERIGVEYDTEWKFDVWKRFITKSGVFASVLFENVAFVCVRPCLVHTETNGDLHCINGPAIAWRDGYEEYYLNGVSVKKKLVMTPAEKIDPKLIMTEKNAEVRREIVRKVGVERICEKLGAKVIDKKDNYELLGLDIGDGAIRPYLKMLNPSIGVYHIEGVHPDCKTVEAAIKWRNNASENPNVLT